MKYQQHQVYCLTIEWTNKQTTNSYHVKTHLWNYRLRLILNQCHHQTNKQVNRQQQRIWKQPMSSKCDNSHAHCKNIIMRSYPKITFKICSVSRWLFAVVVMCINPKWEHTEITDSVCIAIVILTTIENWICAVCALNASMMQFFDWIYVKYKLNSNPISGANLKCKKCTASQHSKNEIKNGVILRW